MMIGKIKSNLILSISVKRFHRAREHVENAGPLGSPLGSPAVQSIPRQARITNTLRSKQSTKTYLHSLKPHFLNPFWPRNYDDKLYLVMLESRWILISCKERHTDRFLYDMEFFSATWDAYFDELVGNAQPLKPHNMFIRNLRLKKPPGNGFPWKSICIWNGSPRRITCSKVMFEVREISHSYYPCPANAALLFFPIPRFLLIFGQFAEFRGKWRWYSHSLPLETLRRVISRKLQ
jgi:hypothetical protein